LQVEVAELASDSLLNAASYIAVRVGEPRAALELLDEFDDFVDRVSDFPDIYPLCADETLAFRDIRKALIKNYLALYEVLDEKIFVIGFFHQRQDYAKLV
jgi:plasmid stabilization system protein ParE